MHILIITHYFSPDSGAAALRLTRLARLLRKRGHQITVLTTLPHYPQGRIAESYRRTLAMTETLDGIQIVRAWLWATPSPRISRRLLSQISFMLSAILRGLFLPAPDVVLIEAQPMFTGFAGRVLSLFKRVPYVLNVSDLWPEHLLSVGALTETHPVYRIARRLVDGLYRNAAAIVAMSPAWAEAIRRRIGEQPAVEVIYNGVDLDRFRPGQDATAFRARHGLGEHRLITFIGTFATQYDVGAMLDVAGAFLDRPDVRFVLIGAGSQGHQLQEWLAKKKLPHVIRIDWVGQDEMPSAWAASYLTYWILRDEPLYRGTIPAKLYEALASGVPVVAAMEGEGAAIVDQSGGGLTVPTGNPACVVSAIEQLLSDPTLYERCAAQGRQYAEAHFDPEQTAQRYEAILQAVSRRPNR